MVPGSLGKLPGGGEHGAVPSMPRLCMWMCMLVSPFSRSTSGGNVAVDGSADLSKLEVSLTLTNKFEGLETDADDTSARSLLLR